MMMMALAFFLSAPSRLSGVAYTGVLATGGSMVWGTIFMLAGLGTVAAVVRNSLFAVGASFLVSALVFLGLASTFAVSAVLYDAANLTAPVIYGWMCWLHLDVARRMFRDHRDGTEELT